jgi:hypothetical protein
MLSPSVERVSIVAPPPSEELLPLGRGLDLVALPQPPRESAEREQRQQDEEDEESSDQSDCHGSSLLRFDSQRNVRTMIRPYKEIDLLLKRVRASASDELVGALSDRVFASLVAEPAGGDHQLRLLNVREPVPPVWVRCMRRTVFILAVEHHDQHGRHHQHHLQPEDAACRDRGHPVEYEQRQHR